MEINDKACLKVNGLLGLIDPVSTETFINDYWEKMVLNINRNEEDFYSSMFSIKDLDKLLSFH